MSNASPDLIQIAIVDDDDVFRGGIEQLLLSAKDRFTLAGSFSSSEAALRELPALRPRIVLMDINLPKTSGIECVRELSVHLPDTEIMMLTVAEDADLVFQSIRAGATGYLVKRDVFEKLFSSIVTLHEGGSPMSNAIARKVTAAFRQLAPPEEEKLLTNREREVLAALAKGSLYKEIAAELGISFHTVRAHVQKIYKKLQVTDRTSAVHKHRNGGARSS